MADSASYESFCLVNSAPQGDTTSSTKSKNLNQNFWKIINLTTLPEI